MNSEAADPAEAGGRTPEKGPAPDIEPGRVSVVIPTLDEARRVGGAIRNVRQVFGPDVEVIVSDGGSSDETTVVAAEAGASVLRGTACRGQQLALGARRATGDLLIFLHADTRLDLDAADAIRSALERTGAPGGCCLFRLDPPPSALRDRWLEAAVNARTRWFRSATGDQAMFATRRGWDASGGIPPIPLFEDVTFSARLRSTGGLAIADTAARTSDRRWRERGFWRTVLTHVGFRALYTLGVPPRILARRYERYRRGADGTPALRG